MAEWKDTGIIIRFGHFHESDLWLKILLKEHGLFTVFAFGGAKSKRRFCGCLDILNTISCRIHLTRTREYHILEEAMLISSPHALRTQWRSMGLMANCLKFMDAISIGPESASECFEFLQDFKNTFETRQPLLAQFFFRLKLAHLLGFSPHIKSCTLCGDTEMEDGIFRPREGHILCQSCNKKFALSDRQFSIYLSANVRRMLQQILELTPLKWPASGLDTSEMRQCGQMIDSFIQFHLGLSWDDGIFKKV